MTNNGFIFTGGTVSIGTAAAGPGATANSTCTTTPDILARVAELEVALRDARAKIPAEIDAAVASLKSAIQANDKEVAKTKSQNLLAMISQFDTLASFVDRVKTIAGYFL